MSQILLNLVGNALKFTEHGEIVVAVSVADRSAAACTLRFSVADTGIGIAEDKLPTLFDAFMQADTFTTRRYGSTGQGLVISKELVRLMGGDTHFRSTPGLGTVFEFTIACAVPSAANTEQDDKLLLPARHMRVLFADDNAIPSTKWWPRKFWNSAACAWTRPLTVPRP